MYLYFIFEGLWMQTHSKTRANIGSRIRPRHTTYDEYLVLSKIWFDFEINTLVAVVTRVIVASPLSCRRLKSKKIKTRFRALPVIEAARRWYWTTDRLAWCDVLLVFCSDLGSTCRWNRCRVMGIHIDPPSNSWRENRPRSTSTKI